MMGWGDSLLETWRQRIQPGIGPMVRYGLRTLIKMEALMCSLGNTGVRQARRARPTLYLNDGKGVFVDVTDSLWTSLPSANSLGRGRR
jgi:hypothetical protein